MTPAGWVFMLTSVTCVTALMVWCFYRVLARREAASSMPEALGVHARERDETA